MWSGRRLFHPLNSQLSTYLIIVILLWNIFFFWSIFSSANVVVVFPPNFQQFHRKILGKGFGPENPSRNLFNRLPGRLWRSCVIETSGKDLRCRATDVSNLPVSSSGKTLARTLFLSLFAFRQNCIFSADFFAFTICRQSVFVLLFFFSLFVFLSLFYWIYCYFL